jgi:2-polyprenyl-3-methyl-5-hydroxy-6-metoxy-1,4-benzoquinol methylase
VVAFARGGSNPISLRCCSSSCSRECFKDSLDFRSGVGSGAIIFSKDGFSIALADVSSTLLDFSRRRLEARGIPATFIDLKTTELPAGHYDFITAIDIFEHIADPEKAVEPIAKALRPEGFSLAALVQSRMRIIRRTSPMILVPPLSVWLKSVSRNVGEMTGCGAIKRSASRASINHRGHREPSAAKPQPKSV